MSVPFSEVELMTVNEAIEKVNSLKDNSYDDEIIKRFIEDCDKRIYREIIDTHERKENIKPYEKRYPLKGDDKLLSMMKWMQQVI